MTQQPFAQYTLSNTADPRINSDTLGQLAYARPDLWQAILANPNCPPQLAAWIHQQAGTAQGFAPAAKPGGFLAFAPALQAGVSVLGLISLFLPAASYWGQSFSFFSEGTGPDGILLLIALLIAIAVSVVALVVRKTGARIAAGIVGVLVGLVTVALALANMNNISKAGFETGFGLIVLLVSGILLVVASILTFIPLKRATPTQSQWGY